MPDLPLRAHRLLPDAALPTARQHYFDGIGWLDRRDVAATPESRIACASTAAAFFAAGQLALAIAEAESRQGEGTSGG